MPTDAKKVRVPARMRSRRASSFNCPECGSNVVRRHKRRGFWQRYILPRLGYFPWACRECMHNFLLPHRRDPMAKKEREESAELVAAMQSDAIESDATRLDSAHRDVADAHKAATHEDIP